jgi:UDP-2,3-diacylglucosamine hydrolase
VTGQRLVVVADAHLSASAPADEEAFLAFLDTVPSLGDSLLLAGDIYDFWFTWRRQVPRHCIRVTAGIIGLARRMPVLMLGGNHDRWGDSFWGAETGVRFDPRQLRFRIGDRDVLAVHGDGLHEERASAAFLNRLLDTRGAIATFRMLPASWGFRIADALGHDPVRAAQHPEVIEAAARRQAAWAGQALSAEPGLGALIMGHTHRAVVDQPSPGRWYLNPGAWLGEHRYALLDEAGARLATFS